MRHTQSLKKTKASGGSAANTIHGLAKLGALVSFVGKIGGDEMGSFFLEDLKANKVTPFLIRSKKDTGKAQALITNDAERTFATSLGAAIDLSAADLEERLFEGHHLLYVEGYLVQNHELLEKSLMMAKKTGLKIALDLASYNVVEDNLAFLTEMVREYVDIVFANEEEAQAFTGSTDPREALLKLAEITELAVVKIGKGGSLISHKGDTVIIKIDPVESIDSTGAGDLYAAGFLFGYIQNQPMKVCGELGSLLAGSVIQGIGAKIPEEKWEDILRKARRIMD